MEHIISVPDMHCDACVKRITAALTESGIDFSVNLSEHTVTVNGCEHCKKTALAALDELGFTPTAQ